MIWKNTPAQYGIPAKAFHWVSALIVLGLLLLGFYMAGLTPGPGKLSLYWWHKSFGSLLFFIVIARLLWRFTNGQPDPVQGHKPWERLLAKAVHVLLYIGMIGMPLSGLLMSAAGDFPRPFFGLFNMPDIIPGRNDALMNLMREVHEIAAFCLLGAVGLHGAGAFKHHFIDRDATLTRMLPALAPRVCAIFAAAIFLAFFCGAGALILSETEEEPAAQEMAQASSSPAVTDAAQETVSGAAARPAGIDAPAWIILPDQSAIAFTAVAQGQAFEGNFERFDGAIFFDPDDPARSHAAVSVDVASVKTGSPERDGYIAAPAWLSAAAFSQARLVTTAIRKTGDGQYTASANLTLRDVTLPVEIPFSMTFSSDAGGKRLALMEGAFTVRRLAFGIGSGEWADTKTVADEVTIKTRIAARAQ